MSFSLLVIYLTSPACVFLCIEPRGLFYCLDSLCVGNSVIEYIGFSKFIYCFDQNYWRASFY